MLHDRFPLDQVTARLASRTAWHPFPTARERTAWEALPECAALTARGEAALSGAWPPLSATLTLEFAREGNRSRYEGVHFTRRRRLADLVLAECADGRGRFLDEIANGVWSTCEESYWGVTAHIGMQQAGSGLPDTAEPTVDLFAAETAALLAWTVYLVGEGLDGVSPLLCPRVAREAQARILTPCLERDDFWWMSLHNEHVNNWNPWVNSNWLVTALLLEEDPARRAQAVAKTMRCVDQFIDSYPEDGGCDEGPSYWGRAGASLFDYLELLHAATGGAIDLFREPKIRNMGRFIYRAHLAERWFLNFADAPARLTPPAALVYRFGRAIDDAAMQQFAGYLTGFGGATPRANDTLPRTLPALFDTAGLATVAPNPPLPRDVWLPETQVLVARPRAGSTAGLCLAVKGGHNAECHNHNDVGHFVVYRDGAPLLVDAGVETYSRATFSAERYTLWTMQSGYHNLPTVNGVMQQEGRAFAARDLDYAADDQSARLSFDLAGAYPPAAGLTAWRRTVTLRRAGAVTVEDAYTLAAPARVLELTLLTPCAVTLGDGVITLAARPLAHDLTSGSAVVRYDPARLTACCEEVVITDPHLLNIWGERLYRILLQVTAPGDRGTVAVEISGA